MVIIVPATTSIIRNPILKSETASETERFIMEYGTFERFTKKYTQ